MELQTVRQVSLDYGISNRMLRYYEQIGLIESSRIDDYAYRVYDEASIKRLHQIIILRKLQIPMKQIKDILNNQNAVAVIEIFKQNINVLDEQITALSTVKLILTRFVNELQEKADVHLKLDLSNDKTMLATINALSFSKNKIKEKSSMEELNKASEALNEIATKNVRIVYMPPMTIAGAGCNPNDEETHKAYLKYVVEPHTKGTITTRDVLKKFIDDTDLFTIKPDTRIFKFDNHEKHEFDGYCFDTNLIWASIPDNLDVPAPLKKYNFLGGWYAVCVGDFNIDYWTKNNDDYEWAPEDNINRPIMEELINPYNRHGSCLQNSYSEENGIFVTDTLYPIRKIKKYMNEEKEIINKLLAELIPHGKSTNIDLKSLIKHDENQELKYTDGLMIIKSEKSDHPWENRIGMATPQKFNCPLKIEMRAKSDNGNISIHYANGYIINSNLQMQCIFDIKDKTFYHYCCKDIKNNEFVNIQWIISKKFMVIKINNEIQYFSDDCKYIKAFSENPGYSISSAVSVNTANGATMTVESLRVTEI